ncbi:MAG TPA: DUF262 domain-containing HNH endonuclease family protein [Tepidisphaeraceae bacterium]|nr:DUF262 domain-containing HNH endonuclease family protein [Tepidisphaeraceae bacterium]
MNDLEPAIEVVRTTLGGALRSAPLRVPNFQREYSWTPARVKKLFDDLNSAMAKRQASYFLGTIVLTPGKPPAVVDGQQRLATTCIFLSAVRDSFLSLGKLQDAKSVYDDFLFVWDRTQHDMVPRLVMNTDDRQFMYDRVLLPPHERNQDLTPRLRSHHLINEAAIAAAARVEKIVGSSDSPAGKIDALNAWIDFIDKSAVIVTLMPPNAARAFQMFKTLNDRAQRTTQADMIKNHLFEHAAEWVDEAQAKWSTVRSTIETLASVQSEDPLMTYLHTASILENGPVETDEIFERLENQITTRKESLRFLESLAEYSTAYAAILTPSHAKWGPYDQRVRRYIDSISQEIKMTFMRPLMLAIAAHFSKTETRQAFRDMVSWVIRFLVSGGSRSGATAKIIGEAAHEIKRGKIRTAQQLHDSVKKIIPSDVRFRNHFITKSLNNGRQARFILRELEKHLRSGSADALDDPTTDTNTLSLEHILPKNPEATGWDYIPAEQRKTLRLRIGNMCLINSKDNGAINDKPFSEKRPTLQKSENQKLTKDVLERTKPATEIWDARHITERQTMMAELAVKHWPIRGA